MFICVCECTMKLLFAEAMTDVFYLYFFSKKNLLFKI